MGKNLSQSRQPGLQKNEKYKPYIKWNKETDEWICKAVRIDTDKDEEMEKTTESTIKVIMTRKELDIIARLIAYMYHDKRDEYEEIASDLRKEHIYKDLRSIDTWLNTQYKQLEDEDEQPKQEKRQRL